MCVSDGQSLKNDKRSMVAFARQMDRKASTWLCPVRTLYHILSRIGKELKKNWAEFET